jgi:hypothetical protein
MTSRGLTAGSFGIFEVERSDQRFVVGGDGLVVLLKTLDVGGDGVLCHRLGFGKGPAVGHTSGQHRNNRGEASLWFRSKHDVEVTA